MHPREKILGTRMRKGPPSYVGMGSPEWLIRPCVTVTYVAAGILYFVSATVNPLLYNVLSRRYRSAFHDSFSRFCCCISSPPRPVYRGYTLTPTAAAADVAAMVQATTGGSSDEQTNFALSRVVAPRSPNVFMCTVHANSPRARARFL